MVESETAHESIFLMKQIMNFAKYSSFVFCMATLRVIRQREKKGGNINGLNSVWGKVELDLIYK